MLRFRWPSREAKSRNPREDCNITSGSFLRRTSARRNRADFVIEWLIEEGATGQRALSPGWWLRWLQTWSETFCRLAGHCRTSGPPQPLSAGSCIELCTEDKFPISKCIIWGRVEILSQTEAPRAHGSTLSGTLASPGGGRGKRSGGERKVLAGVCSLRRENLKTVINIANRLWIMQRERGANCRIEGRAGHQMKVKWLVRSEYEGPGVKVS